jgi:hypothetical protein
MHAFASFRFLSLSQEQADKLAVLIPCAKFGEHYKSGKIVGSIELIDSSYVVTIDEFKRSQAFLATDCDIFISIASDKKEETWRAPKVVNYLVNIVNCPIVFSYTC